MLSLNLNQISGSIFFHFVQRFRVIIYCHIGYYINKYCYNLLSDLSACNVQDLIAIVSDEHTRSNIGDQKLYWTRLYQKYRQDIHHVSDMRPDGQKDSSPWSLTKSKPWTNPETRAIYRSRYYPHMVLGLQKRD